MIFVCSWDDGHPLDRRLADLLSRRELRGTFYVPLRNREGRAVMEASDLRAIDDAGFEIGSHTADHRYLDALDDGQALSQIRLGREGLENVLGKRVPGFCYPGGKFPTSGRELLERAGISYARSVENLRSDMDFNAYAVPTTLQFYPHGWPVLARNALRAPKHLIAKVALIWRLKQSGNGLDGLPSMLEEFARRDGVFHLWGHSWEVDRLDAWKPLGRVLDAARACASRCLTVAELVALRGAARG